MIKDENSDNFSLGHFDTMKSMASWQQFGIMKSNPLQHGQNYAKEFAARSQETFKHV